MKTWTISIAAALTFMVAGPAAAQAWTQCVARAPSGTLFVGEPSAGADPAKGAAYRTEFIKAGRAGGGGDGEIGPDTAFCFTAASEAALAQLVAAATKPCATCSAPYSPKPVAWSIRDILPTELAARSTNLVTLVMSEPPPAAPEPAPPAAGAATGASPADTAPPPAAGPIPPPPRPLASARWRTLLCGAEVRVAYALETPADSPVERAPFRARALAPQGGEALIDTVLEKATAVPPTCGSAAFVRLGDLSDFLRGLPPRGDERLAALQQRLDDVTVTPAPSPEPAAVAGAAAPIKATAAKTAQPVPPPPAAKTLSPPPKAAAPSTPASQPAPAAPPAASPAAPPTDGQIKATAALNDEINRRNAEVEARNAAAAAAHEKRMAEFKAAQDAYERAQRAHEADVARAAAERAAWEAKVKACQAGDRAACSQ